MMDSWKEESHISDGENPKSFSESDDPLASPWAASNDPLRSIGEKSYPEPPSYEDVLFSDHDNQNGVVVEKLEGSESFRSLSRSSSEYLKVLVSDPQKEQETYVTYLITTKTNVAEFSVRRRFRDVVTLADRLSESYRGFFIPPRPDKSVVESQVMQKHEFMEQRRVALDKYLTRLAGHPVINKSHDLKAFLQLQGRFPLPTTTTRMLDPNHLFRESVSVQGGRDLLRLFKEMKQSVANDWGAAKPQFVEEDKDFLEKKEKLRDLELQLSNASQQAESLVKAQQDMGETMGQLGLAFVKLTKFETEEAMYNSQRIRAADTKRVATAAVKASRLYRESNAQTVKHLDTLHEYLGLMLAVHSAFSDRSSALLTVQTLLSELSSLHSRAEKLEAASSKIFGGDKSRIRKMEDLKDTIRITEDAKICAVREYESIKENNRSEVERLDRDRHDDFLNMLKGFVINQVGYAEKIANVWANVAEETIGYVKEKS